MLSDTETYCPLSSDPTNRVQNKTNALISKMKNNGIIDDRCASNLKCHNGVFPKIYFLPKIHKEGIPLRPIVSFVGSPTYKLSKWMSDILKNAFDQDDYHVKDSFQFADFIRSQQSVPNNYILVSLDVQSLFTNIPTDLVVQIITQKWDTISAFTNLSLDAFVDIFHFCIESNYFNFNGTFYKQTFGLGMGDCMSPICADLVMSKLQSHCLSLTSFHVPFFKRYVDDIVTAIPNDKVDDILNIFNSFHSKLQFTIEVEQNNAISFLDTKIIRSRDNRLKVDWYQKPTFSGRFISFHSFHSFRQKINVIKNLKHRALNISDTEFHSHVLNKIRSFLWNNNFPMSLVNRILNHNTIVNNSKNSSINSSRYFKIPYVKHLSEKIGKILSSDSVTIAFSNENTIGKRFFSSTKEKTPFELKSNVVYKIPCKDCNKCYIGQTGRYMNTRINEHRRDVCRANSISAPTALVQHVKNENHHFDFDNTAILSSQQNLSKRLISEMIHIKKNKSVNYRQDIDALSNVYHNLIKKFPNR
nr:unnamed protein product [Callosobruchus analis]